MAHRGKVLAMKLDGLSSNPSSYKLFSNVTYTFTISEWFLLFN